MFNTPPSTGRKRQRLERRSPLKLAGSPLGGSARKLQAQLASALTRLDAAESKIAQQDAAHKAHEAHQADLEALVQQLTLQLKAKEVETADLQGWFEKQQAALEEGQAALDKQQAAAAALQAEVTAMQNSLSTVGDLAFSSPPELQQEITKLGAEVQQVKDDLQRTNRETALSREAAKDQGDGILLVAHAPAGPEAILALLRMAVAKLHVSPDCIKAVVQHGHPNKQRGPASQADKAAAAAALAAAAAAGEGAVEGPGPSGAAGAGAPASRTEWVTYRVYVTHTAAREAILSRCHRLKGTGLTGQVYFDYYVATREGRAEHKALQQEAAKLRRAGQKCRFIGPLQLEQFTEGTWQQVPTPAGTAVQQRGGRGKDRGGWGQQASGAGTSAEAAAPAAAATGGRGGRGGRGGKGSRGGPGSRGGRGRRGRSQHRKQASGAGAEEEREEGEITPAGDNTQRRQTRSQARSASRSAATTQ